MADAIWHNNGTSVRINSKPNKPPIYVKFSDEEVYATSNSRYYKELGLSEVDADDKGNIVGLLITDYQSVRVGDREI